MIAVDVSPPAPSSTIINAYDIDKGEMRIFSFRPESHTFRKILKEKLFIATSNSTLSCCVASVEIGVVNVSLDWTRELVDDEQEDR